MNLTAISVELGRILRFGAVGLCATFVYVFVTDPANKILGFSPVAASMLGVAASIGVSYFGHTHLSFRVKSNHRDFLWRFLVVAAFAFGLSSAVTWLIADYLKFSERIAILAVAIIIPAMNYVANRFWVFMPGLISANLMPARLTNRTTEFDTEAGPQ